MDEYRKKRLEKQNELDKKRMYIQNQAHSALSENIKIINEIDAHHQKAQSVIDNSSSVIADIHNKFKEETKLNEKDIVFLFAATALQTLRWILMPRMDFDFKKISTENRLDATEGAKIEKDGITEILQNKGFDNTEINELYNQSKLKTSYSWTDLLIAPVPYDAMVGSENIVIDGVTDFGKNIYGKNHHSATWGHDPIAGWIVGPMNITARMITFRNFKTYHVEQQKGTFIQKITTPTTMFNMLGSSISTWSNDSKTLFASVAKQGLHLQSDKYTKMGLPIPLLSPEKAQSLLEKGWNSNEMERLLSKAAKNLAIVGAQFGIAFTIDQIIKALHLLCYDDVEDGSISTYLCKTQKIICYSTGMAEIANGIYVAASRDFGKLDIGGYVNFAKNLITSAKLKTQIETEFMEKELSNKLVGDKYYWEEKNVKN